MITYALGIEFIGTQYRGWQIQEHDTCTIQAHLQSALSKVANEPIEVVAAGRTDAGVHAANMICHMRTHANRPIYNWIRGTNTLLPKDIAIRWMVIMPDDFHARFKAKTRRYRYITLNQPHRPALLYGQVTHHYLPLDIHPMQMAVQDLIGIHDCTSFRASACQSKKKVRHILRAELFSYGSFLVFDIEADGFLHHMVRNIMGTLFAIGTGELPQTAIKTLLAQKNRTLAPATASADGLYFINATYEERFQTLLPKAQSAPLWLNLPII